MGGQKIECLVIIADRDRGEQIAELYRSCQLYFAHGIFALGTAGSDLLDYLETGGTDKELLFYCLPIQLEYKVMRRIAKETQIREMGHGTMFIMSLSGINNLSQRKISCGRVYGGGGMEQRGHRYGPIIAVVERGWHGQVVEAAKETSATGDTALRAHSLHESNATSFPSIRLQGEKDIVVVLSVYENYEQIIHEINMAAGLQTEAKGPIFSILVDEFIRM